MWNLAVRLQPDPRNLMHGRSISIAEVTMPFQGGHTGDEERMHFVAHGTQLALHYGTRLPAPKKPRLQAPGFFIGATCGKAQFSPDGRFLHVPTSTGDFLWDVRAGCKLARLRGLSNPRLFAFATDSRSVLLYNESWQFARYSIPDGGLLETFRARYAERQDGSGCLGPDGSLLHLAYGGVLLQFDARGSLLLKRQLDPTGYDGQIHWLAQRQELWISQVSMHHNPQPEAPPMGRPCALWRWRWPLHLHEPERLDGSWVSLHSAVPAESGCLWLHHCLDAQTPQDCRLQLLDLETRTPRYSLSCPGSIGPQPVSSHDMQAWAVQGPRQVLLNIEGRALWLPGSVSAIAFSPVEDLVALSGEAGLVVPRAMIAGLIDTLQVHADAAELRQRGYGRMTTMPDKALAPRVVVYARPGEWLIQCERMERVHYRPLAEPIRIADNAAVATLMDALDAARQRSCAQDASVELASPQERRGMTSARVSPPAGVWSSAVAVVFAADTLDLWPMKPKGETDFEYAWYPMASIPPDTTGKELLAAIRKMLLCFKPRCA